MGMGVDWPGLVQAFLVAFSMAGLPIFLHLVNPRLAILFSTAMALLAARAIEQDLPIIVLTVNIFQNIFVSLVSPNFSDFADTEPLKSYSFVITVVLWLVVVGGFLKEPRTFSSFVRKMMFASLGLLAIVGVYFVLGLMINPRNAIVYMRNIGLPILLFQMFLLIAAKHSLPLPAIVSVILALVAICGYLELFATDFWLTVTNGWTYLTLFNANRLISPIEIKAATQSGEVVTSVLDFTSSNFLNIGLPGVLDFKVQRLQGPNFHPISFGYLLAVLIAFSAVHQRKLVAFLALPLLLLTSAKGPIVLLIACVAVVALARHRGSDVALKALLVGLLAYAIFVFQSGVQSGDYHVLGLLGGVNGFLKWPIGHSLGEGGNLSVPDFSVIDWSKSQHEGATDLAVESAVGVLLFQLGLASAAFFLFYSWISSIAWRLFSATNAPALAFTGTAILITLVNGLFQEEAYFAPLALGLVMGFAGLSLGATDRAVAPFLTKQGGSQPL